MREVVWLCGLGLSLFIFLALLSFDAADPGYSYQKTVESVKNVIGPRGAFFSDLLLSWFGFVAFGMALLPLQVARWLARNTFDGKVWIGRLVGFCLLLPGLCILLGLHVQGGSDWLPLGMTGGGILGGVLANGLVADFGVTGTALVALVLGLTGVTVIFHLHWLDVFAAIGAIVSRTVSGLVRIGAGQRAPAQLNIETRGSWLARGLASLNRSRLPVSVLKTLARVAPRPPEEDVAQIEAELLGLERGNLSSSSDLTKQELEQIQDRASINSNTPSLDLKALSNVAGSHRREPSWGAGSGQSVSSAERREVTIEPLSEAQTLLDSNLLSELSSPKKQPRGKHAGMALPHLNLLDPADRLSDKGFSRDELTRMGDLLIRRLREFGVEAGIVAINPGPVVTRFEIDPAPGVKVSRITNLAKDVARSLAVISVRVVEVIPGKSTVGIEIPNQYREMVRLSQILGSESYIKDPSILSLALGHDISGQAVCANLAKMPHLLVAGTTGSGKSVGVNVMILSMLYKARPEDLRLILVDPKMLELSVYEGIPHLLAPVVTDMKDAANALRWCVGEMERRYRLMAELGVRNLDGFNTKVRENQVAGTPLTDPMFKADGFDSGQMAPELTTLPFIVVVIDEFADMMMIVGKKVDQLIARLAQKARAAGIHLILATQRPSVDVITGLIKANVPSRISFQVSSKIDSRTVLDQGGAEQLLGHGDMLYLPAGKPIPVRVHGAFVDDHEVHKVVSFWKSQGQPQYEETILSAQISGDAGAQGAFIDDEADALYDEAVAFVTETRRASISAVQRRLKIGYNRAARMIEAMEAAGVVSEMGSNGGREVIAPEPR